MKKIKLWQNSCYKTQIVIKLKLSQHNEVSILSGTNSLQALFSSQVRWQGTPRYCNSLPGMVNGSLPVWPSLGRAWPCWWVGGPGTPPGSPSPSSGSSSSRLTGPGGGIRHKDDIYVQEAWIITNPSVSNLSQNNPIPTEVLPQR